MFHRELIISVAGDKQTGAKPVARSSSKHVPFRKFATHGIIVRWHQKTEIGGIMMRARKNGWRGGESCSPEGLIALELVEMLRDLGCDLGGPLARIDEVLENAQHIPHA